MLVEVVADDWRHQMQEAHADGFTVLDLLTAVDRRRWDPRSGEPLTAGDLETPSWEFLAHVIRPSDMAHRWIRSMQADSLSSIVDLYPAASWHEREVGEMFGIEIIGGDARSTQRLLLSDDRHPLRKDTALPARLDRIWPGASEPGASRRRVRTPGVPVMWQGSVDADGGSRDDRE